MHEYCIDTIPGLNTNHYRFQSCIRIENKCTKARRKITTSQGGTGTTLSKYARGSKFNKRIYYEYFQIKPILMSLIDCALPCRHILDTLFRYLKHQISRSNTEEREGIQRADGTFVHWNARSLRLYFRRELTCVGEVVSCCTGKSVWSSSPRRTSSMVRVKGGGRGRRLYRQYSMITMT